MADGADKRQYGAVFDCDGTLLDSMREWMSIQFVVADACKVKLSEEDGRYLMTCTVELMAEYFLTRFDLDPNLDVANVKKAVDDHMMEFYSTRSAAKAGVGPYLKALHEAGIPVYILSSTSTACLKAGLTHCGLIDYVDQIISGEEYGHAKTERYLYELCAQKMGIAPEDIWYFDDSVYALNVAREVGMHTVGCEDIGVTGTYDDLVAAADMAIHSFEELKAGLPPVRN